MRQFETVAAGSKLKSIGDDTTAWSDNLYIVSASLSDGSSSIIKLIR